MDEDESDFNCYFSAGEFVKDFEYNPSDCHQNKKSKYVYNWLMTVLL